MSVIDTLITDRLYSDVAYAQELTEKIKAGTATEDEVAAFLGGLKGAYNYTDLNRVGEALNYIASRLNGYGYSCGISAKTDWAVTDIPLQHELEEYRNNIAQIRESLAVFPDTPEAPDRLWATPGLSDGLNYEKANAIEKILLDLDTLLNNMTAAWYYSGEIYAGEV